MLIGLVHYQQALLALVSFPNLYRLASWVKRMTSEGAVLANDAEG